MTHFRFTPEPAIEFNEGTDEIQCLLLRRGIIGIYSEAAAFTVVIMDGGTKFAVRRPVRDVLNWYANSRESVTPITPDQERALQTLESQFNRRE